MLSRRGQLYAESGLMSGYMRDQKEMYNVKSNPQGEVSFANAENVCPLPLPHQHTHEINLKLTVFNARRIAQLH
jgi:hypothetical protein